MRTATEIATRIEAAEPLQRDALLEAMRRAHGLGLADGAWSLRDAYDALEAALVLLLQRLPCEAAGDRLERLLRISANLPTHSARSERQVELQQFSTPLAIGALATKLLRAPEGASILDPSAGTGMLVAHLDARQVDLRLNERDVWRAAILASLFPNARHGRADAETLADRWTPARDVDLLLINPPFARSEGRGEDRAAGYRHLRAGLRCLKPGGRAVAILPGWYDSTSDAWTRATVGWRMAIQLRLPGTLYARHGTQVSVKLVGFERSEGAHGELVDAPTPHDALAAIEGFRWSEAAIREDADAGPAKKRAQAVSLFSAARHQVRPDTSGSVTARKTASATGCREVAYHVLDAPAPTGTAAGLYLAYRPSRIAIPGARPHPTPLVESNAMGSIAAPKPRYRPLLPEVLVEAGALSDAQLETLIYAGDAFERDLAAAPPVDDDDGDGAIDANRPWRAGFFLGDGTGAGKGRQVAAILLDQWLRGRRKAVWISMNEALIEDARRDWTDLGGLPLDIQPLGRWKLGTPIDATDGILFLTYATLRSDRGESGSRLKQLLDWLGPDFDGVIVFDEAHAMANAAGSDEGFARRKGSEQGIAGLALQARLPRARILYVSATGASDVDKLAYATRLGLWGAGTPFANRRDFVERVRRGGVAAMEVVARDLKALGRYFARALSYAGVEYAPLEHALTPAQIAVYDAYADAFAIIHDALDEALDAARVTDGLSGDTLNKGAKAAAFSAFESAKQRFFGALLLAMKLPSLIPAIEADLGRGDAVVVQLVTTGEAMLERQLVGLSAEERAEPDIELSPREYVIGYLERAFPTRMMEVYLDEEGETRSRPMVDEDGNPVLSLEALAARDALIERLCAMPAIGSALDHLIAHFGTPMLAEVTGRSQRLVIDAPGRQRIDKRSASANVAETAAFMRGDKRILVFSNAGGTGRSYHASLRARNQARRVHYLLEPGWRADVAIQGLGRTHRTEQASAPLFRPVATDCRGERRFISTIARRLDAMGAITRGQRQTGGQGMFDPRDNLESPYAKEALLRWYRLLFEGKLASIGFDAFCRLSGLKLLDAQGGLREDLPPIQRWLNRILALRIATQNAIFDEFLGLIEARIEAAKAAGTLDVGVETITADRVTLARRQVVRTDAASGAETLLVELETEDRVRPRALEATPIAQGRGVPMRNARSGKVAAMVPAASITSEEGRTMARVRLVRPLRVDTLTKTELDESAWERCSREAFDAGWRAECAEVAGRSRVERLHMLSGLLLPVWSVLPDEQVRVWRITTDDGQAILGRIVPTLMVERVTQALGTTVSVELIGAEIARHVLEQGEIHSIGAWRLKRSRVSGEARLELVDWDPAWLGELKALGLASEIIAHRTRLFLPSGSAAELVERLTRLAPPGWSTKAAA